MTLCVLWQENLVEGFSSHIVALPGGKVLEAQRVMGW